VKGVPAVAEDGALSAHCVVDPALTLIVLVVPVIEPVTVSVAVTVWLPAVLSVTDTVFVPFAKVVLVGTTAAPSLLAKWIVPP
jgi:hypothetical protein